MELNKTLTLELIASQILENSDYKEISNRQFMNAVIIFQEALLHKMIELQTKEEMCMTTRAEMSKLAGENIRKLIKTFTNLDTHEVENFI